MLPSIAEGWTLGSDGRSLTVALRPKAKFSDGSPVDSSIAESLLPSALRTFMGPVFSDVDHVKALGKNTVEIASRERAPFLIESLEAPLQKPSGVATGPFVGVPNSTTDLVPNPYYYLGPPTISRIHLENYPSVRTAWAEMLRDRIDMLYEVGPEAMSSMQNSSTVAVFTITRRYQFVIILNPDAPVLRSAAVRRALSLGVDRAEVVRNALNGYGIVSSGPLWPRYWALDSGLPKFEFDPASASKLLGAKLQVSCLVPRDAALERIALEVKRQLAGIGVDLKLEEGTYDEVSRRAGNREYEALLTDLISGPTLLRLYLVWHSTGPLNYGHFGTPKTDIALERVRHALSEDGYRKAVTGLQQAFMDDPPAIFLAWSQRARAVSRRFDVPTEGGRDILGTLRLWKPTPDVRRQASRN
jgi:peptide/nickel transport system substrate-binding protein